MKKQISILKIALYSQKWKNTFSFPFFFFFSWEDFKFNPFILPWIFKTCSGIETEVLGLRRWENPLRQWGPLLDLDQGSHWPGSVLVLVPASTSNHWGLLNRWDDLGHSFLILIPVIFSLFTICCNRRDFSFFLFHKDFPWKIYGLQWIFSHL